LAKLTNLEILNLGHFESGGNRITDLTPLEGLKKLKELDLMYNLDLTQAEVDKLKDELPLCGYIGFMDAENQKLSDRYREIDGPGG